MLNCADAGEGKVWHRVDEAATRGAVWVTTGSRRLCSKMGTDDERGGCPPGIFSDVWQLKDLQGPIFVSVASKGLTGAFFGSVARKGLSGFDELFTNDYTAD
jgi:hypothetical protein